jgi:transcriptional regulator with XRE-family HTH domain
MFGYMELYILSLVFQTKKTIMESIKELRLEKKITQEKLAQLCGLTTVTINRAEKSGKMRLSTYETIINTLKNLQ